MNALVVAITSPHHNLMRKRRFHVQDLSSDVITVTGTEADHALRVLRLGLGDEVVLFDGAGTEAEGRVSVVGQGRFDVQITRRGIVSASKTSLILTIAPPKGSRGDWLVEKCAELGVAQLWLLHAARSVVEPGAGKLDRWRRIASEAAKQSGQAGIMSIVATRSIPEALAFLGDTEKPHIFFGRPGEQISTLREQLNELHIPDKTIGSIIIFIGPEGGFTVQEEETIERAGGQAVRLSSTILRVETAAIAAAAIVAEWRIAN